MITMAAGQSMTLSRCAWNILQGGYGWLSERKLERWKIRQKMQRIECSSIVVPPDQNHLVYKVTATGNMHFFVFREYYGFKLHNYMVGRKTTAWMDWRCELMSNWIVRWKQYATTKQSDSAVSISRYLRVSMYTFYILSFRVVASHKPCTEA